MENPYRKLRESVALIIFGIILGSIPGMIRLDQMRREVEAERAETQKLNDGLRAGLMNYERELSDEKQKHSTDRADCQNAILGDGARTILLDLNHPWGSPIQQVMGVSLTLPPPGNSSFATGPMWVIPRAITPHVVDGVLGAAYTHIWPDGRTDGWQRPSRAE